MNRKNTKKRANNEKKKSLEIGEGIPMAVPPGAYQVKKSVRDSKGRVIPTN